LSSFNLFKFSVFLIGKNFSQDEDYSLKLAGEDP